MYETECFGGMRKSYQDTFLLVADNDVFYGVSFLLPRVLFLLLLLVFTASDRTLRTINPYLLDAREALEELFWRGEFPLW